MTIKFTFLWVFPLYSSFLLCSFSHILLPIRMTYLGPKGTKICPLDWFHMGYSKWETKKLFLDLLTYQKRHGGVLYKMGPKDELADISRISSLLEILEDICGAQ